MAKLLIYLAMNELINKARLVAHTAHEAVGQVRKYTNEPYWVHTDAVARTVAAFGGSIAQQQAAHLHDTLEDTKLSFGLIESEFGTEVAILIWELTDQFTPENYPDKNRAWRKEQEAARIATISNNAKIVKLADLYHNTFSIIENDRNFAIIYLKEKARVIKGLKINNPLFDIVNEQLKNNLDKLAVVV